MIKKLALSAVAVFGLAHRLPSRAGGAGHVTDYDFSFEGPFGKFDQNQLQRGLQVYTEVCAACHGLKFVPIRTLSDEGGPHLREDQVRAYAPSSTSMTRKKTRTIPRAAQRLFPRVFIWKMHLTLA